MGSAAVGGGPLQSGAATAITDQLPLVVGGVLAVAVLGVLGWVAVGRLRSTPGGRFRSVLASHDEIAVLLHPNPDPDAMASGMVTAAIAETEGTDATIQFPGTIERQENRAFETVLGLDCDRIEAAGDVAADAVVLVDHNEARGFHGAERIDPVAVVDHHPGDGDGSDFTDIRPDHGACATIFAEYCEAMGLEPGEGDVLSTRVATGLLYGIQSDTKQLTSGCSKAEFAAAAYLYDGIDEEALDRIANPEVDAAVLDVKAEAIRNREVRNAYAVSDVGTVGSADAVPQAAEELLRLEGVSAVVVLGERDGTIHLSGRSRDDRVHMGRALRTAVEDIPMAEAGGHARMGGGQLSVDHMEGIGPSDGVSREEFHDRLFDAMTGDLE
jgi:nanoRNase/pAp phosphatase (c-di-AMP/oligoRNAs hydrolase)